MNKNGNFLVIQSKGLIEPEAISLIGATTKRGDSTKIGMYGSGLSYSVANMVSKGIPFFVFSGLNEIRIGTVTKNFRGKAFNVITVNGQETSLVDQMGGSDWDSDFSFIREIYSNALDEDKNAYIDLVDDFAEFLDEQKTTFVIQANPNVVEIFNSFSDYFASEDEILETTRTGSFLNKQSKGSVVYRKGIVAFRDDKLPSLFAYNLDDIGINESRVVRNVYEMYHAIAVMFEENQNEAVFDAWMNFISGGNAGALEHKCILEGFCQTRKNPRLPEFIVKNKYYPIELKDLLDAGDKKSRIGIPKELLTRFLLYAPDADVIGMSASKTADEHSLYVEKEPPVKLFDKTHDAISRLKDTKYKDRVRNQIKYCAFKDQRTLALADKGIIWLSIKLEDFSVDEIAKIIIEEQEHLISGFGDCTRDFQNHLFNILFDLL